MVRYCNRPLMAEERKYTFRSCTDIEVRSGLIGCTRISMTSSYEDAAKTWCAFNERLNTEGFQREYLEILSVIRLLLPDKDSLRVYYNTHLSLSFSDGKAKFAGMSISTERYCYLLRINPSVDIDNVLIFCYLQERLKSHIRNAAKGIRFVDKRNRELFTIRDGERITLYPSSEPSVSCRYIDPFTCKIGSKKWNIRDLADYMEKSGKLIIPA